MDKLLFSGDFFPYGTHYYRAPTPMEPEWEGDFAEIARQKYTHVQFRPQWRKHERIRGKYVWDDLDKLCDLAQKYNLKVVMQTMLETAPDWVYTELNGTRIGFNGLPLEPDSNSAFYVGGWLPCFDNPEVAKAAYDFNYQLAARYKDHPAFWFFNAWNEPRSRPAGECRCSHSIRSYQNWLKDQYGTIEALNEAFGKEWTSFETIRPAATASDYTELHLWRQWAEYSVAQRVKNSYEGLRAGAPDVPIMTHIGVSSVMQDPVSDTSNDILNAKEVDFYGCSFPARIQPKNLNDHALPLYQCSWMRRVDTNYWVWEFYANNAEWCKTVRPEWLEQMLLMALSSGCKGFTFWQYRSERFGNESNGWGMRNVNGTSTPRSDVCDKISHFAATLGRKFSESETEKGKVALLYHRKNDILGRIQIINLAKIMDLWMDYNYPAMQGLKNVFTMYQLLGNSPEFVTETDDLSQYKVVHLSSVEMMDAEFAGRLRDFCRNGGTLIVSYPFACRDFRTWVEPDRPSFGLHDLTGCREGLRQVIGENDDATVLWDGLTVRSGAWMTELIPDGGTVIANWNDFPGAAVVEHTYGKGKVLTCGINLEMGWDGSVSDSNLKILGRLLEQAGLTLAENPMVWQVKRGGYLFVFNPGEAPQAFTPPAGEIVHSCSWQEGMLNSYGSLVIKLD